MHSCACCQQCSNPDGSNGNCNNTRNRSQHWQATPAVCWPMQPCDTQHVPTMPARLQVPGRASSACRCTADIPPKSASQDDSICSSAAAGSALVFYRHEGEGCPHHDLPERNRMQLAGCIALRSIPLHGAMVCCVPGPRPAAKKGWMWIGSSACMKLPLNIPACMHSMLSRLLPGCHCQLKAANLECP